MSFLGEHKIDLTNVQKSPMEDEEEAFTKINKKHEDIDAHNGKNSAQEKADSSDAKYNAKGNNNQPLPRLFGRARSKIARLEIPSRGDVYDIFKTEVLPASCQAQDLDSPSDEGYETAEESFLSEEDFMFPKSNLFGEDDEEEDEKPVPKEKIMKRIDSHKGMKSYQLAQQLSSKWSTGAGPRISCMRDYPSELQFRVLEQANLSPKRKNVNFSPRTKSCSSPTSVMTPPTVRRPVTTKSPLSMEQRESSERATK